MHVTLRFVGGVQLRDVRWGRRRPVRHVLLPSAESQPPSWHLLRPAATSAADASRAAAPAVPAAPAALASGATTPTALVSLTTPLYEPTERTLGRVDTEEAIWWCESSTYRGESRG